MYLQVVDQGSGATLHEGTQRSVAEVGGVWTREDGRRYDILEVDRFECGRRRAAATYYVRREAMKPHGGLGVSKTRRVG